MATAVLPRMTLRFITNSILYCNVIKHQNFLRRFAPAAPEPQSAHVSSPANEYRARLELRRAEHAQWSRRDVRFAYTRLAVFGAFVLLLVFVFRGVAPPLWLLLPAGIFVWL